MGNRLLRNRQVLRDRQRLLRQRVVHVVTGGRRLSYCWTLRGRRSSSRRSRASLRLPGLELEIGLELAVGLELCSARSARVGLSE